MLLVVLAHWLKEVMTAVGIDMFIFKAHSVRTAAVSAVATRLPLLTILRTGGWTQETTFSKFYNKPVITEGDLQKSLLDARKKIKLNV